MFDLQTELDSQQVGDAIDSFNDFSYESLFDLPLTKPFPFRDETIEDLLGFSTSPQTAPKLAPELALSSPEAPVAPAPVAPVQAGEPVSPGLLGDNPVEIVRNLELAQRTRRGA